MTIARRAGLAAGLALVCAVSGGCATRSSSGGSGLGDPITAAELDGVPTPALLEAIRRLRPQWLRRARGVCLDGFSGGMNRLEELTIPEVGQIRIIRLEEASRLCGASGLTGDYLAVDRR